MKRFLPVLTFLVLLSSLARAADLSEAEQAFKAKTYDVALSVYFRLAQAGDAEAQFRLGQMTMRGQGTPADPKRARALYEQAAAAGNVHAQAALEALRQRPLHAADIAYWTDRYDGADLKALADCKAPVIPQTSTDNEGIRTVFAGMAEWRGCYNRFAHKMEEVMPIGSAIPADLAAMFNEEERVKALTRLNTIYVDLTAEQGPRAQAIIDDFDRWMGSTEQYAMQHNKEMEGRDMAMRAQIESLKRQYDRLGHGYYPPAPQPRRSNNQ